MKKKIICILLILFSLFIIVSCSGQPQDPNDNEALMKALEGAETRSQTQDSKGNGRNTTYSNPAVWLFVNGIQERFDEKLESAIGIGESLGDVGEAINPDGTIDEATVMEALLEMGEATQMISAGSSSIEDYLKMLEKAQQTGENIEDAQKNVNKAVLEEIERIITYPKSTIGELLHAGELTLLWIEDNELLMERIMNIVKPKIEDVLEETDLCKYYALEVVGVAQQLGFTEVRNRTYF